MSDEFGFSEQVQRAVDAAKTTALTRITVDPKARHRRTHWRTNKTTGEIEQYEEFVDPVPDAVAAAIANNLTGGKPIESPFEAGSNEDGRFWAGVESWRARL